jgi:hypothetical protein
VRATKDIDILVPRDHRNMARVLAALPELPYGVARELDASAIVRKPITIVGDDPRVDILTVAWAETRPAPTVWQGFAGLQPPVSSASRRFAALPPGRKSGDGAIRDRNSGVVYRQRSNSEFLKRAATFTVAGPQRRIGGDGRSRPLVKGRSRDDHR